MNTSVEVAWPARRRQVVYLKADDLDQWPTNQTTEPSAVAQRKSLKVFNSFRLSAKKGGGPETVLDYLEGHYRPHHSEAYERFLFRIRFQELRELFEDFVADLHYRSHFCNFGEQRESMVRDQVIVGCRDRLVRQQLLDRDNLGLEEALQIGCCAEEKQPQHTEDSSRHPITSSDEEKKGDVKERQQTLRRKARSVRKMAKKLSHWHQEVDDCPRKQSLKTYV